MKIMRFLGYTFMLLIISSCKNGAESLPELAGKIFDGLQKNSRKLFLKAVPDAAETEKYFTLYHQDKYPDAASRKKEAANESASMRLSLLKNFADVLQQAKEKNIDWEITKISDLKFNTKDNKNGYQEAKVRMILESGIDKNVIIFDAIKAAERWYLIGNLGWEE